MYGILKEKKNNIKKRKQKNVEKFESTITISTVTLRLFGCEYSINMCLKTCLHLIFYYLQLYITIIHYTIYT